MNDLRQQGQVCFVPQIPPPPVLCRAPVSEHIKTLWREDVTHGAGHQFAKDSVQQILGD